MGRAGVVSLVASGQALVQPWWVPNLSRFEQLPRLWIGARDQRGLFAAEMTSGSTATPELQRQMTLLAIEHSSLLVAGAMLTAVMVRFAQSRPGCCADFGRCSSAGRFLHRAGCCAAIFWLGVFICWQARKFGLARDKAEFSRGRWGSRLRRAGAGGSDFVLETGEAQWLAKVKLKHQADLL